MKRGYMPYGLITGFTTHHFERNKCQKTRAFSIEKNKFQNGAGFTLIELMIVVALIVLVSAFTLPVGFNFYQTSTLKDQARNLENSLRQAQAMAITGRGESSAGIAIFPEKEQYVIFEGESYQRRTTCRRP